MTLDDILDTYEEQTVKDVKGYVREHDELDARDIARLRAHEQDHENRVTLVEWLESQEEERGVSGEDIDTGEDDDDDDGDGAESAGAQSEDTPRGEVVADEDDVAEAEGDQADDTAGEAESDSGAERADADVDENAVDVDEEARAERARERALARREDRPPLNERNARTEDRLYDEGEVPSPDLVPTVYVEAPAGGYYAGMWFDGPDVREVQRNRRVDEAIAEGDLRVLSQDETNAIARRTNRLRRRGGDLNPDSPAPRRRRL